MAPIVNGNPCFSDQRCLASFTSSWDTGNLIHVGCWSDIILMVLTTHLHTVGWVIPPLLPLPMSDIPDLLGNAVWTPFALLVTGTTTCFVIFRQECLRQPFNIFVVEMKQFAIGFIWDFFVINPASVHLRPSPAISNGHKHGETFSDVSNISNKQEVKLPWENL